VNWKRFGGIGRGSEESGSCPSFMMDCEKSSDFFVLWKALMIFHRGRHPSRRITEMDSGLSNCSMWDWRRVFP
jgi:hypothetical protein